MAGRAYHRHQHFTERRQQIIKRKTKNILDRISAPAFVWLLAMCYVFVLNHAYNSTIKNIPLNTAMGSTCDISPLIRFHFWEPIFFNTEDSSFPIDSPEERGQFVGISEHFGHDMNFKILNVSTNEIINRSNIRSVNDSKNLNLRAYPVTSPEVIKSLREHKFKTKDPYYKHASSCSSSPSSFMRSMPKIDPNDLVGRNLLLEKEGNHRLRNRIFKDLDDFEGYLARDSSRLKFV